MSMKDKFFEKYNFTEEDFQTTLSYHKIAQFKAKQYFLKEGQVSDKLGMVMSGLFRAYFINDEAEEITTDFFEPGQLIISGKSYNEQIPAEESIIAILPSEISIITRDEMIQLYTKVPQWNQICIDTVEYKNQVLSDRAKEFQTLSATERYLSFCKDHPLVYQNATLGQIASYLGIDIATLSRIRKKAYKS
jgi:CRP-like cAMP-binding protein